MSENYVKVSGEVINGLSPEHRSIIQVVGGLVVNAIADRRTIIYPQDRIIEAPANLYMSTIRDNETVRDFDMLVLTTDQDKINVVEQAAKQLGEGRVEISAFGLKPASLLDEQKRHPLVASAKTWVGDRYFDPESNKLYRALFPLAVEVPLETLATYTLVVGDSEIPVPAPAAAVLNYTQRSIGGLRPKDYSKVEEMWKQLHRQMPDIDEDIHNGIFREQVLLTALIDSLRRDSNSPNGSQLLGLRRFSNEEILRHSGFMLENMVNEHHRLAQGVLKTAQLKAQIVHAYENSPKLVGFWQNHIESKVGSVLKNK